MNDGLRIAIWSGPRNISTAMMRAWQNRGDCQVIDEPFYACYLAATGIEHPMREEILASQPRSWQRVIEALMAPLPQGIRIQYQKQMAHHMVGDVPDYWFARVRHAFLIRDPAEMIASYAAKRETLCAADLGLARQVRIYQRVTTVHGQTPPIIDAKDVLGQPARMLRLLCEQLGVAYTDRMCHWPAGRRESDGVWAAHWYNAVEQSTGFAPYRSSKIALDSNQQEVLQNCLADYRFFHDRRLTP